MTRQVVGYRKSGGAVVGAVWIAVISLPLFWLPFFGPLIAGFVGGKQAGTVGSALGAVFLPAILLGMLFFVFGTAVTFMPLVGAMAGAGGFIAAVAFVSAPLLIGAILGGALA